MYTLANNQHMLCFSDANTRHIQPRDKWILGPVGTRYPLAVVWFKKKEKKKDVVSNLFTLT